MHNLQHLLFFLGFPRSGHTFFAQCLNSRTDTLVSNEYDLLWHMERNPEFSFEDAINGITNRNESFCRELDYVWESYRYEISPEKQLHKDELCCVGDKKGTGTTLSISADLSFIDRLQALSDVAVKYIVCVRNPLDNIATLVVRKWWTLEQGISFYEHLSRATEDVIVHALAPERYLFAYHDDFISNPSRELDEVCRFLALPRDDAWKSTCESKIYRSESKSRNKVRWSPKDVQAVYELCKNIGFLNRYAPDVNEFYKEVQSGAYSPNPGVDEWEGIRHAIECEGAFSGLKKAIAFTEKKNLDFSQLDYVVRQSIKAGEITESLVEYTIRSLDINPVNSVAYDNYALLNMASGNVEAALVDVGAGLKILANDSSVHRFLTLGKLLHEIGRESEAIDLFRRALAIDVDNYEARIMLCDLYRELGKVEQSIAEIRNALSIKNDSPYLYHRLSNLLVEIDDIEGAKAALRRSLELILAVPCQIYMIDAQCVISSILSLRLKQEIDIVFDALLDAEVLSNSLEEQIVKVSRYYFSVGVFSKAFEGCFFILNRNEHSLKAMQLLSVLWRKGHAISSPNGYLESYLNSGQSGHNEFKARKELLVNIQHDSQQADISEFVLDSEYCESECRKLSGRYEVIAMDEINSISSILVIGSCPLPVLAHWVGTLSSFGGEVDFLTNKSALFLVEKLESHNFSTVFPSPLFDLQHDKNVLDAQFGEKQYDKVIVLISGTEISGFEDIFSYASSRADDVSFFSFEQMFSSYSDKLFRVR